MTVKEALEEYENKRKERVTRITRKRDERLIGLYLSPYYESEVDAFFALDSITEVYEYISRLDLGDTNKGILVRIIKEIYLKYAETKGFSSQEIRRITNVLIPFRLDRDRKKRLRILTFEEYGKLLEIVDDPRDLVFIKLIYETGASIKELLEAKWGDFNPSSCELKLHASMNSRSVSNLAKFEVVKIPYNLAMEIGEYRYHFTSVAYLFPSKLHKGYHMNEKSFRNRLIVYGAKLGIDDLTSYSISQSRLVTELSNLIDMGVAKRLMSQYHLSLKQLINKYKEVYVK